MANAQAYYDKDPKTKLNHFLQKLTGRVITRADVVYSCSKIPSGQFQAYVTLNCLEETPQFAGEPAVLKKEAEMNSARQALAAYQDEVEKMFTGPQQFTGHNKRKFADPSPALTNVAKKIQAAESFTYRFALFEVCSKIMKHTVRKGEDIIFHTEVEGWGDKKSYTCSVTIPVFAEMNSIGLQTFYGAPANSVKDAEENAAKVVFKALCEVDEEPFKEHMTKIVEKREKFLEQRKEVHERQGMEALSYDQLVEACRGAKGGGRGAVSARARRFPVSDEKYTGKVIVFHDYGSSSYGLITPGKAINHPKAAGRSDVWFSLKDVIGCTLDYAVPEWLQPGCAVSFKIFTDNMGLGAEEVTKI